MKNKNIILNIIFAFAIALLFILNAINKNATVTKKEVETVDKGHTPPNVAMQDSAGNVVIKPFPVAYVVLDSLMKNYTYFSVLEKHYESLVMSENTAMNNKEMALAAELQKEYEELEYKAQMKFINETELQKKAQELKQKEQTFLMEKQKKGIELQKKEASLLSVLNDSALASIKLYNSDNKFELILNDQGNSVILQGNPALNITDTVLKIMQSRYKASAKK